MHNHPKQAAAIEQEWKDLPRWKGIKRDYDGETVARLRGSIQLEYTLASMGADRLWDLLHSEHHLKALGAMTGLQAVQQVSAGLKAIYLSGWQVAADANLSGNTYPDQSLYPADSAPSLVRRINNALIRADQISHMTDTPSPYWFAPIVADQVHLQKPRLEVIPIRIRPDRHLMFEEGSAFGCTDPPWGLSGIERTQNPVNSRMTDTTQLGPVCF